MNDKRASQLTRQELYDLVWKTPMTKLAAEFGLSDVGLAKVCKRYDIPRPPVGYWAKLEFGKKVTQTPLPPRDNNEVVSFATQSSSINPKAPLPKPNDQPASIASEFFDPELGRLADEELQPNTDFLVDDQLKSPHPLIKQVRERLKGQKAPEYGQHRVPTPMYVKDSPCLDVSVSSALQNRAFRIMDCLVKALEKRGYEFTNTRDSHTVMAAFGYKLNIRIREPSKRAMVPKEKRNFFGDRYEYVPTGLLQLEIGGSWSPFCVVKDGKKKRVEDGLSRIPLAILRRVDWWRRKAAEREEEDKIRREEDLRRQQEAELLRQREEERQAELRRRELLFQEAETWDRCCQLRQYIGTIRELTVQVRGSIEPGSNVAEWLAWAETVVNEADPLVKVFGQQVIENHVQPHEAIRKPR